MTNARLWTSLAAASLMLALPARAGDEDAQKTMHDALVAQLPTVHTETRLPDANEAGTGGRGEQKDKGREHKNKDGERDRKDSGREGEGHHRQGREHEGADQYGEAARGDMGEHGEVGEHVGSTGSGPGGEDHGGGSGHDSGSGGSDKGGHDDHPH
jgi:hypothetical protein